LFHILIIGLILGALERSWRLFKNFMSLRKFLSGTLSVREVGDISIRISESLQIPFSVLLGRRAYVILPSSLVERSRDFRVAILHELQHHRNRDTAWAFTIEILLCLFYLNPFLYLWKREISNLQEFSCDEILIGRRKIAPHEYGSCLVRVAEAALNNRAMFAGTACMAAGVQQSSHSQSSLRRRIEMFHHYQSRQNTRLQKSVSVALGTLVLSTTLALAYGSERTFRKEPLKTVNPGTAVVDPAIQQISERILKTSLDEMDARAGFVIVSDPNTGKLLAVANQIRDKRIQEDRPHWVLSHRMEPASAIKSIVAAAALEQEVTTIDQMHSCEKGKYQMGGRLYEDHSRFDQLTTADTVAQSSDICSIKIGEKLGASGIARGLQSFGFGPGGSTEGFPEALAGEFPAPDQLPANQYIPLLAGGYVRSHKLHTTPLEVIQAYGAIANGGKLMKPLSANAPESDVHMIRRVQSEVHAQQMKDALVRAVTLGTGRNAKSTLYSTAGKTSTGHYDRSETQAKESSLSENSNFGGFVGFAPVASPKIAVYAVVFEPKKSAPVIGNRHAAPVFKKVAEAVLQHMKVAPDLK
jgi:hypothetical protein